MRVEGYLNPEKKLIMLGITNWYGISGRNKLINKHSQKVLNKLIDYNPYEVTSCVQGEKPLDPFHTHFLLIDSGDPEKEYKTDDKDNKVLSRFRQNYHRQMMEAELAKSYKIPIIRLVIGKDQDKLFSIRSAVENKIPCLFLKVFKIKHNRFILINYILFQGTGSLGNFRQSLLDIQNKMKERRIQPLSIITPYVKYIIESEIIKAWNENKTVDGKRYINCIWKITNVEDNLSDLFYEYSFSDKNSYSFDYAILKTIFQYYKTTKKKDSIELIKMVIDWKRYDIAKSEIFDENIEWVSENFKHTFSFVYYEIFLIKI